MNSIQQGTIFKKCRPYFDWAFLSNSIMKTLVSEKVSDREFILLSKQKFISMQNCSEWSKIGESVSFCLLDFLLLIVLYSLLSTPTT